MPEAVIVATGRTPIGRAFKGSLVDMRPDDLTALVIRTVLAKLPELDPQSVEDVIVGCGQPAGESGFKPVRVTSSSPPASKPSRASRAAPRTAARP